MSEIDTIQPLENLMLFGQVVPFYALTFDKRGKCTSPRTRDAVARRIKDEAYTDVLVYSHGWNTDWSHAVARYKEFFTGVSSMTAKHASQLPTNFKPLLIGISWPSAALVWPSEATPDILAAGPMTNDVDLLSEDLDPAGAAALAALASNDTTFDNDDIDQLSAILAPALGTSDDLDGPEQTEPGAQALATMFRNAKLVHQKPANPDTNGISGIGTIDDAGTNNQEMEAAGLADLFGVRQVLRLATVLQMKDRAGVVGRKGVADAILLLLGKTAARLHLIGHSYGCKVLMTALSTASAPRMITSALLLQPAVNNLAFSANVEGRPGGFREALARVEKPIFVTHSRRDFPLRQVFHLAVRRKRDLGEIEMLAAMGKWSAMGGFGPGGMTATEMKDFAMPAPGVSYPLTGQHRVLSIEAHDEIRGHNDVTNRFTFWSEVQALMR